MSARKVQVLEWRAAVESVIAPLVRALRHEGMPAAEIAALLDDVVRNEASAAPSHARKSAATPRLSYAAGTRVVSRWRSDPAFSRGGVPQPLPSTGPRSFSALARAAKVDASAARDALQRLGLIRLAGRRVTLRADAYVPARGVAEKLDILGRDGAEFLRTMLHNVAATSSRTFLQRKTSYDNIGGAGVPALLGALRQHGTQALMAADGMLAAADRDRTPTARGGRRMRVSFGVYCFSEPVSSARATRRRKRTPRRRA